MLNFRPSIGIAITLCFTSACVSAPRPYGPQLQPPAADQVAFEQAFRLCADDVAAGKRSNFQASRAATATGIIGTVGGAQMVAGGASALSIGGAGVAVAGLGVLMLTPVAIYGLSRAKRARAEKEIKQAMSACLAEDGYVVADWRRLKDADGAAGALATPVKAATPTST